MKERLPLALSALALCVAVLGFTPIVDAASQLIAPNSVASKQIRDYSVKRIDLASNSVGRSKIGQNAVNSSKVADGSLSANDFAAGQLPQFSGTPAAGDLAGIYPNPTLRDGSVTPTKIGAVPLAHVSRTTNQSIPTGGAGAVLLFDSERFDTASLHRIDADSGRLTAPIAGAYLMTTNVAWDVDPTPSGAREVSIRKNGTTVVARAAQGDSSTLATTDTSDQSLTTIVRLNAGDFVEVFVRQSSGAALDVLTSGVGGDFSPEFSASWIAPLGFTLKRNPVRLSRCGASISVNESSDPRSASRRSWACRILDGSDAAAQRPSQRPSGVLMSRTTVRSVPGLP